MAGIKEEKKIYLVGIYCRLSKDDGTDNERNLHTERNLFGTAHTGGQGSVAKRAAHLS